MTRAAGDWHARELRRVRRELLAWYAMERRDFPWRRTHDPWAVLVSEVMLQQTQASRIATRFPPFLEQFPTPDAMAAASEADVLVAWAGLGYNRRALALHRAAFAVQRHGWPRTVEDLRHLPGVGPYTARALAALAFGQPVGAVDTNVRRWLTRRFPMPSPAQPSDYQALADALATADGADSTDAAAPWMHASMEFGARVCRARDPDCAACPIATGCPSRERAGRVPVRRQPPFNGSDRALRGDLLRQLTAAPDRQLPIATARKLAGSRFPQLMAGLERDRLAHRSGRRLMLGGRAAGGTASTIEA
jgi:A/G-specific adenine glycosylase